MVDSARINSRPDDDVLAAQARTELTPLLQQVADIQNRYKAHGLAIGWSIASDQYGRDRPTPINIMRVL